MAREKTTISVDRAKAEQARELVHAPSVSDTIDLALDRLIFEAQAQADVAGYRAHSQGAEEREVARSPMRHRLDDDPTDWEAFYANRKHRGVR